MRKKSFRILPVLSLLIALPALASHFKGHTQYFSGDGQSLIDYNNYRNVLGIGMPGTF